MKKPLISFEELMNKVRLQYAEEDARQIEAAYLFAEAYHQGQKRKSGEDYIIHPRAVADIIVDLGLDAQTVQAAMLHDVLEDTACTREEMGEKFGAEVLSLVEGVTKLDKINFNNKQQAQAENLRKMLLAMCKDLRVILLKLADRLHNMRTLGNVEPEKQRETARETLDIYAPLAARLGIMQIKSELEDLCMRYLWPQEYYELAQQISSKKTERDAFVATVVEELDHALKPLGLKYEINGRSKQFYSIYRKMQRQHCGLDEIYDLFALRVILDEDSHHCYDVLGVVHSIWTPLLGRIKDYISTPKPNNYQSLHTTVIAHGGAPFEVQIRTREMHRVAEYGVAAHWKYKDGKTDKSLDRKIAWIRMIMEQEADVKDSKELMDNLRADIFSDEVFVFTPKGDVIVLPVGSNIIDFAYAIHTKVGERCSGGKVNMRMVPLSTPLKTGDIVEVITMGKGPSRDWLTIAKSSSTRNRIRAYFKRHMREENIKIGRSMLEAECRRRGYPPKELLRTEWMATIAKRYSLVGEEDVFAAIGCGELTASQVATRLLVCRKEEQAEAVDPVQVASAPDPRFTKAVAKAGSVLINGQAGMLVRMSKCCSPVPGDPIVGYISRGRGISVHRADCVNVVDGERERLMEAEWADVIAGRFDVSMTIVADDRQQLVADVCNVINNSPNVNLSSIGAGVDRRSGHAVVNLTVDVDTVETLSALKRRFSQIKGVIKVERKVK
ncbi:MAG: bifunctional (p)ppGpp synthetase/guanosine-3',5'-bis(diphosphate) 3'-pyrophosphohydrolase [Clostridia bacterium]|nr:bifunctional (p)ppGpp synthetase/guanosine-3',5'-bis(diphosphate) 3'-pyrophosphohydrolase [Clostridia bacterium]